MLPQRYEKDYLINNRATIKFVVFYCLKTDSHKIMVAIYERS